MLLLLADW